MIIVVLLLVIMVFGYIEQAKNEDIGKSALEILLKYSTMSSTVLNLVIFILYAISFAIKLIYCFNNDDEYFDQLGNKYIDTMSISKYYNIVFYFECLLFASVVIKFFTFLRLNDHIKLFFNSIEMGISIFVKYAIFFVIIMLGYACIGNIIWGPYVEEFGTIGDAFLNILLLTMGMYMDLFNF